MRAFPIFFLLLVLAVETHGQQTTFQKLFDYNAEQDKGIALVEIPGGGYYVLGENTEANEQRNFVSLKRLDQNGNIVWNKILRFSFIESGLSDIEITSDLGCVIVGIVWDTIGATNPYGSYAVIKVNPSGNVSWNRFFKSSSVTHLIYWSKIGFGPKTNSSRTRLVISGDNSITISSPISNRVHVFKVDSIGNLLWSNLYCLQGPWQFPQDLHIQRLLGSDFNNTAIVSIVNEPNTNIRSTGITMLDEYGQLLWMKTFDYQNGVPDYWPDRNYRPTSIRFHGNNSLVVAGGAEDTIFNGLAYNPFLLKTDVLGSFVLQKRFERYWNLQDFAHSLSIVGNQYLIGGRTDTHIDQWGSPIGNGFLSLLDSSGTPIWSNRYGQQIYTEYLRDVVCNSDGGFSGLGFMPFIASNPTDEVWLVKTDANGSSGCFETNINFLVLDETQIYTRSFTGQQILPLIPVQVPYTFTDFSPTVFVPCFTQDVPEISNGGSLIFFPNPAPSQIIIHSEGGVIEMYDSQGKLVYAEREIGKEYELNLSKYSSGIYLVRVYSDGKMMRGRLIISR